MEQRVKTRTIIEVIKTDIDTGEEYRLPLTLESEGTKKLLTSLGPIYKAIIGNQVLVIDEFDNKFHTLLSRFFIEMFHAHNNGKSQLILTCHDTQLLSSKIFRRDQIWFLEKNRRSESQLYSLVEFKEYYNRKDGSYTQDYLQGKYGAIMPLLSFERLESLLNGEE